MKELLLLHLCGACIWHAGQLMQHDSVQACIWACDAQWSCLVSSTHTVARPRANITMCVAKSMFAARTPWWSSAYGSARLGYHHNVPMPLLPRISPNMQTELNALAPASYAHSKHKPNARAAAGQGQGPSCMDFLQPLCRAQTH